MKLSFYTPSQCMTFVDPITHQLVNAGQLQPGMIYDVFAVIKNEDPVEYENVQVNVVHSAFGIGLPGGSSYIVQPDPVDVPPALNPSQPGLATMQFQFIAPPAGHGCLTATILLSNAKLYQNLTVLSAHPGASSTISFLVFADPNVDETMLLTLEQRLENGSPVAAAERWPDQFVVPQLLTPTSQTSETVTLHIPRGNTYYSIGINVTIPPTATVPHVFFVHAMVNGVDKGSVSLLVKPDPMFVKPHPYVREGYESPDIVLIDPKGNIVPLFGNPITDTIVLPNTDYTMRVIVHNSSTTPAVNTIVRMWELGPGGLAANGPLLDIQSATVPGNGQIEVTSKQKFHSGPLNTMNCAMVTLYNAQSDNCTTDYPTTAIPGMQSGAEGPFAMRNTHSRVVLIGEPWRIQLVTAYPRLPIPLPGPFPFELEVDPVLIPRNWQTVPEVVQATGLLRAAGTHLAYPAFLLPGVREKFERVDLEIEVQAEDVRIEAAELVAAGGTRGIKMAGGATAAPIGLYRLQPKTDKPVSLTISGKLPRQAQDGDTILVRCSARYPKAEAKPAFSVQFTEALYVMRG